MHVADRTDLIEEGSDQSVIDFRKDDDDLRRDLQEVLPDETAAEWTRFAAKHRFICSPAPRTLAEALDDPHLPTARDLPSCDGFTHVGIPAMIRDHPYAPGRPAAVVGEDTVELLGRRRSRRRRAAPAGRREVSALTTSATPVRCGDRYRSIDRP